MFPVPPGRPPPRRIMRLRPPLPLRFSLLLLAAVGCDDSQFWYPESYVREQTGA